MQSSFIRTTFIVLGLVVAFVFVPLSSGLLPDVAAQGVEQSVTGHVEFDNPNGGGRHVRYSVSAIRDSNGFVRGEVEELIQTQDGQVILHGHGTVTCFTVNGNIARIGGLVGHVVPPANSLFPDFRLTVVDNGEGNNELPAVATPIVVGPSGTAQQHCDTGFSINVFPLEKSSIQIRP